MSARFERQIELAQATANFMMSCRALCETIIAGQPANLKALAKKALASIEGFEAEVDRLMAGKSPVISARQAVRERIAARNSVAKPRLTALELIAKQDAKRNQKGGENAQA